MKTADVYYGYFDGTTAIMYDAWSDANDPKGVMGCPIHEVWACVENPQQDLKFLSAYFDYPFKDVAEWYYVRLILAACWQAEDGLDANRFLALAQSVLPTIEPYSS